MPARIDYAHGFAEGANAMFHLNNVIRKSGLDPQLLDLVRMRASQLNGCAYCIDMHSKEARAHGESEQRLYALSAWRETPFFSGRECAALAWTEVITNIQQGHAEDSEFQAALKEFGETDLIKLTLAITQINAWNRIAIAFRAEVGSYQPGEHQQAPAAD